MSPLTVLPVIVPMLVAAILLGGYPFLPRRVIDIVAIATAAAVAAFCGWLAWGAASGPLVTWAGSWRPRDGVAVGISFVVDPIGAGLAALSAALATASFVFSWRYFKAVRALYHSLMLVFLAGMTGFCLTGDLFNLFVFFELMSVAAYALTAYKIEEEKSLEGGLNFAVVNSLGAFLILIGIGLLYARTGALNLAQIGRQLGEAPADGLVVVSFVLIVSGLAVKGALVPFHFWLADAHAVAPAPVSVLFSGVMVEMGIFGIARVYWTIYDGPMGPYREAIAAIFLTTGAVSAVLGGLMSLAQRHIKRLLAFSTISHMGMILIAVGLFDPIALAGASVYVVAHGMVKGALFLLAGVLLHCLKSVDEGDLRGAGRKYSVTGIAFAAGAIGLAGLPPFGTGPGKAWIEEACRRSGRDWLAVPLVAASALTAAAVLRVAGRVFLGWGPHDDAEVDATPGKESSETRGGAGHAPLVMLGPAITLLALAALSGLAGPLFPKLVEAARRFTDSAGYQAAVLDDLPFRPLEGSGFEPELGVAVGPTLLTAAIALLVAIAYLFADRLPRSWQRRTSELGRRLVAPLRTIHSGKVGDYVTWLVVGVAAFGLVLVQRTGTLVPSPLRTKGSAAPVPRPGAEGLDPRLRHDPGGGLGPARPGAPIPSRRAEADKPIVPAATSDLGFDRIAAGAVGRASPA